MVNRKRIVTAAVAFIIAGGTGYISQNGEAIAGRFSTNVQSDSDVQPTSQDGVMAQVANVPTPPVEAVLPRGFKTQVVSAPILVAAAGVTLNKDTLADISAPVFFTASCDVAFTALPSDGAMVSLSLDAPCYQNQRIEISHGGLAFADSTKADGSYAVEMPALFEFEPFTISFMDGRSVEAKTLMLTVDGYERAGMTWSGNQGLHIHAFEGGAEFGEPGHVWAEAPNSPETSVQAEGGFLIELGNPDLLNPLLSEVYSFPVGRGQNNGPVELYLEAEVNDRSCGGHLTGKVVQIFADGQVTDSDLSLSFPACDGENGYLVLNNLFQDMKVVQN